MPDSIARKRLKKKMLDRWENEGGRIADEHKSADEDKRTSHTKRKQSSASRESTSGVSASLTIRRMPTRK